MLDFTTGEILVAGSSIAVVVLLTVLGQFLYATDYISGEYARKFIHMLSAAWIASWMFFMEQSSIIAIGLFLIAGAFIARNLRHTLLKIPRNKIKKKSGVPTNILRKLLRLLDAVYSVRRPTYGEVGYGIGIVLAALITSNPYVFGLSIINLGFADGLAAVVGTKYGKRYFKILGAKKSRIGTYTCFVFVVLSGLLFWFIADTIDVSTFAVSLHVVSAGLIITCLELLGRKGLDNIFIPAATALLYSIAV
ncbi:MAG: hypothetical protein AAF413_04705 [Patescibacteria group bacterium]